MHNWTAMSKMTSFSIVRLAINGVKSEVCYVCKSRVLALHLFEMASSMSDLRSPLAQYSMMIVAFSGLNSWSMNLTM